MTTDPDADYWTAVDAQRIAADRRRYARKSVTCRAQLEAAGVADAVFRAWSERRDAWGPRTPCATEAIELAANRRWGGGGANGVRTPHGAARRAANLQRS